MYEKTNTNTQTHKHTNTQTHKHILYATYLLLGGIFISNSNYAQVFVLKNGGIICDSITSYGIYQGDGSLSKNTVVSQGSKTLDFTTTITDGFSVDGSSFSVDGANHRVGVKTTTPTSTLGVSGSFSLPVRHVIGAPANITLGENDHTIIVPIASAPLIYLPSPRTCPGRIYRIIRHNGGWTWMSGYISSSGVSSNAYYHGVLVLQSVGSYWQQIN